MPSPKSSSLSVERANRTRRDQIVEIPAARATISPWLFGIAVAVTLLGIVLRFSTLDTKLYTNDEATTSLRVAGHRTDDYLATLDGRVRTAAEIAVTMQGRVSGATPATVARALAIEEPQHAPLYYVIERAWQNVVGDGLRARRALSAVAGSLLVAGMAWLAFEMFGTSAAFVVAILVSLSPFHLVYAQQAREYALWAMLVAVVTALLVRAIRTNSRGWWLGYSLGAIFGLYTDSLFLATLLAHGVALAVTPAGRRCLWTFTISIAAALAAYSPWLWFLIDHARQGGINAVGANKYLETPLPATVFAVKWLFQIGAVFFDSEFRWPALAVVIVPIIAAIGYALVRMVRERVPGTSLVVSLVVLPSTMLVIPDLLLHQSRSTAARYLMPTWIGLELAIGWLIASSIASQRSRTRRIGAATLAGFALAGGFATVVQSRAEWSWTDGSVRPIGPIARNIDAAFVAGRPPLVLWQAPFGPTGTSTVFDFSVVELANVVLPNVRFQQFAQTMEVRPAAASGNTFLLNPSDSLRASFQMRGYRLTPVYRYDPVGSGAAAIMHRQTATLRKTVGFADIVSSLWKVETPPHQ